MQRLDALMSLRGRRALLTGGAGHIAVAMAETLAELGANLVLVDKDGVGLEPLAERLRETFNITVETHVCDLENETARQDMVSALKAHERGIDILINNAAFVGTADLQGWAVPFEAQTVETWRRAFEVNITAVFDLSKGLLPLLRASNEGVIVNVGSIYGELGPDWRLYEETTMGNPAAYSASKGGLLQLTRWMATTLAPEVRVNAISPGGVARGQPESFVTRYEHRTPLRRMATEDDFRGAIAYLASDLSAYVTGQVLRVDGGWGTW